MKLPNLYKKDVKGNILGWRIFTENNHVITRHGRLDGKIQEDCYEILDGTNIGRANYRTKNQQAEFEADAKWKKQLKYKGYFDTKEAAQNAGDNTPFGALKPMKAQRHDKHSHKLTYPLYVQPKLNGLRCIAVADNNNHVRLFRSGGKEIKQLTHLQVDLHMLMEPNEIWDGEIYCHGMPLEKISGIVRAEVKVKPKEELKQLEYWVFDAPKIGMYTIEDEFSKRLGLISKRFLKSVPQYIKCVRTIRCDNKEEADNNYRSFVLMQYEGMMYRDTASTYKPGKRSYEIQKRKDFQDDDFLILEANEGKGRAKGLAVSFTCQLENGNTVDVPMNGTDEYRKELWYDHSIWEHKWLQVRYLERTSKGSLEIPKGLQIRDKQGVD